MTLLKLVFGPVLPVEQNNPSLLFLLSVIAASILKPKYEEKDIDYEWRLQFFELIPPIVRELT
jgi:hypothetical protein